MTKHEEFLQFLKKTKEEVDSWPCWKKQGWAVDCKDIHCTIHPYDVKFKEKFEKEINE